jgi:DNA-binding transcriptional LysR family regulator
MEVDVGLVVNPIRHPDLVIQKLCDDEVTFWTGPGGKRIQDLRSGEAIILCDPNLTQVQTLLKKLKKLGMDYKRIVASSSLEVISQLTVHGAGVGILPSRVAALSHPIKMERVYQAPVFLDEISIVYRIENKNVRAIQMINDSVRRTFKAASMRKAEGLLN